MALSETSLTLTEDGTLTSDDCSNSEETGADAELSLNESELEESKSTHAPYGLPAPTASVDNEELIANREFLMNHDADLMTSTWVSFRLRKEDVMSATRIDCFRADPRLEPGERAETHHHKFDEHDQGHLVARADMNRSKNAMLNSYVLSNMAPQLADFNQGVWERFESFVRKWAKDKETLHIVTGAIYDEDEDEERDADGDVTRSKPGGVAVATHFYKIILHEKPNGFIESIAILLPHNDELERSAPFAQMKAHLKNNITSIDEIEGLSGYDFFSELPDGKENAIESSVAGDLW